MERVTIEVTNNETRYKACDGTLFTTEIECKRFEASALCVIKSRLMSIVEKTVNPYEEGLCESCDYAEGFIINLEDESKIDIVNVYLSYYGNTPLSYNVKGHTIVVMRNSYDDCVWAKDLSAELEKLKSLIDSVNKPF